jgi:hypothetical protein
MNHFTITAAYALPIIRFSVQNQEIRIKPSEHPAHCKPYHPGTDDARINVIHKIYSNPLANTKYD